MLVKYIKKTVTFSSVPLYAKFLVREDGKTREYIKIPTPTKLGKINAMTPDKYGSYSFLRIKGHELVILSNHRHRIGCVVATGRGKVGYSLFHENKECCPFNKKVAKELASGRAIMSEHRVNKDGIFIPSFSLHNFPPDNSKGDSVFRELENMYYRSLRYFKESKNAVL